MAIPSELQEAELVFKLRLRADESWRPDDPVPYLRVFRFKDGRRGLSVDGTWIGVLKATKQYGWLQFNPEDAAKLAEALTREGEPNGESVVQVNGTAGELTTIPPETSGRRGS